MNIDLLKVKLVLGKGMVWVGRFSVALIAVIGGVLAALVINSIGNAITVESSESVYVEEIATFKSAVFDEDVIAEVIELSANDVNIRAKLPVDRDNPFLDF